MGTLRCRLLRETHDPQWAGHPGINRMVALLARRYYWPRMEEDVEAYVRTCLVCQLDKVERKKEVELLQPLPIPEVLWQSISMDFISGFLKVNGLASILVVVDRFSKYGIFIVAPHACPAETTVESFFKNVTKYFGVPKDIVSDRDARPMARRRGFLKKFHQDLLDMDVTLWQFEEKLDEYWAVREGVTPPTRASGSSGGGDGRSGCQALVCAGRHAAHHRRTSLADARTELDSMAQHSTVVCAGRHAAHSGGRAWQMPALNSTMWRSTRQQCAGARRQCTGLADEGDYTRAAPKSPPVALFPLVDTLHSRVETLQKAVGEWLDMLDKQVHRPGKHNDVADALSRKLVEEYVAALTVVESDFLDQIQESSKTDAGYLKLVEQVQSGRHCTVEKLRSYAEWQEGMLSMPRGIIVRCRHIRWVSDLRGGPTQARHRRRP
ncbi:hypothetical protein Sango_2915300 [Sesamum angolense]|uniref:Integrase zinc-binding domain-containing protein n=1 Tax=Sesamum angolense TaxID=2727404 RepID=A0AAE1T5K2_9LAMI|nr:hypothetical protein Sango_2915300 [Sesamum angolense]